ncbi:MAG: F0F1 ATP synthase subunit epsilon [Trueperaceae bacterium]|nr:MAG: F0F1 ATP synthase subunit epsilon [Trueperaceae bacterium]
MRLKVLTPFDILVEEEVTKVIAEAKNGSFCLLPRHIDTATVLVPSLLSYVTWAGDEVFLAVDEGVLIKRGDEVTVSCRHVIAGADLGRLKQAAASQIMSLDQREKKARSTLAKLEADFIRRFVEFGEAPHV